jgi:hypothetical protein
VPEFEVWDSSSIAIKTTANDLQRSLAANGFSSQSIEADVYALSIHIDLNLTLSRAGGAFGVSAGISAMLKADKRTGRSDLEAQGDKEYYAVYNVNKGKP